MSDPTPSPTPSSTPPEPTPTPTPEPTAVQPALEKPIEAKPEPVAPVALTAKDVKLPEGFEVDQPALDKALGIMNDSKLTSAERLQQLVNLQADFMKSTSEKGSQLFATQQEQWQGEIRADPVFGGDKLDANLGKISKLIDQFAEPQLREAMDLTGMGNHPAMVRFLAKVADKFVEGGMVLGQPGTAAGGLVGHAAQAAKMFPDMKQ